MVLHNDQMLQPLALVLHLRPLTVLILDTNCLAVIAPADTQLPSTPYAVDRPGYNQKSKAKSEAEGPSNNTITSNATDAEETTDRIIRWIQFSFIILTSYQIYLLLEA